MCGCKPYEKRAFWPPAKWKSWNLKDQSLRTWALTAKQSKQATMKQDRTWDLDREGLNSPVEPKQHLLWVWPFPRTTLSLANFMPWESPDCLPSLSSEADKVGAWSGMRRLKWFHRMNKVSTLKAWGLLDMDINLSGSWSSLDAIRSRSAVPHQRQSL